MAVINVIPRRFCCVWNRWSKFYWGATETKWCGRVHRDCGGMTPRHICPGRVGSLGTVKPEAEHLSGLLGHSGIKWKGTKYWWPSCLPSAAKQEEISNFLQNIWRKGDFFICSSSVLAAHVGLCCCSKEDDLVQSISALFWKTVYKWLKGDSLVFHRRSVARRIPARFLTTFPQKLNEYFLPYWLAACWEWRDEPVF